MVGFYEWNQQRTATATNNYNKDTTMTTSNIENPNCRGLVVVGKLKYVCGGAEKRIEVLANEHTRMGAVKDGNNEEQQTARTTNYLLRTVSRDDKYNSNNDSYSLCHCNEWRPLTLTSPLNNVQGEPRRIEKIHTYIRTKIFVPMWKHTHMYISLRFWIELASRIPTVRNRLGACNE